MQPPSDTRAPGNEGRDVEAAPVKRPVRVNIYNQTYTLVTSGNPADVEDLARVVDELLTSVANKASNVDTARAAVLACLHLADKVRTLEKDLAGLRSKHAAAHRRFTEILDRAIETPT